MAAPGIEAGYIIGGVRRALLAVGFCVLVGARAAGQQPDLAKYFVGMNGTFVLLDAKTGAYLRHNPERAARRFPPCSTFKIPNTAILLETGAAPDPEYAVAYDPALKVSNPDWARDHTLRSAFRVSALWYDQAIAERAGMAAETRLVRQFNYGNGDTSGGLAVPGSPFWIDGTLRISANEQVDFLKRLHEGMLGVSMRTTQLTEDIMVTEVTSQWTLRAKTGACQPRGEDTANWYVGIVEKPTNTYYFALQMGDKNFGDAFRLRVSKARDILSELGILR